MSVRSPKVVALASGRLRQLDRRDVLTRLVRIVAVLHRRHGGGPEERVERLTRAVTRGRTDDLKRLVGLERRLAQLERRLS